MFEKIWDRHAIFTRDDGQTLLYIDRHLVHDGYGFKVGFFDLPRVGRSFSVRRLQTLLEEGNGTLPTRTLE
ncbi:MAG: 3-isopropylmalate dehydratase large subunit, partial [Acidiferrobacterales bacterium]